MYSSFFHADSAFVPYFYEVCKLLFIACLKTHEILVSSASSDVYFTKGSENYCWFGNCYLVFYLYAYFCFSTGQLARQHNG